MARRGHQKKMLIPLYLSPKALSKPDQSSWGNKGALGLHMGKEMIASFKSFAPLLTFPHGNAASKQLYTEDCRVYGYRAQKRRLNEEGETQSEKDLLVFWT